MKHEVLFIVVSLLVTIFLSLLMLTLKIMFVWVFFCDLLYFRKNTGKSTVHELEISVMEIE